MANPTSKGREEDHHHQKRKKMAMLISLALFFSFTFDGTFVSGQEVGKSGCTKGEVGGCLWDEGVEVVEMESESSRRVLWPAGPAQKKASYISYEALKGDVVPCSRPGASYYNCRALPRANNYVRGCTVITGCDRG